MKRSMPPETKPGDIIAGKYRVERILGQGAMGMVVAAMHVDLHERRAIKFMLRTMLDDEECVERFLREARACAKLKSKHVATVYDVGRLDHGAPYIVMEYLEGTDLKDVLDNERMLPVPRAVEYILQALEAVGEAHQAGIIHRDLKPANMYLTTGVGGAPCIKILDFGIAKVVSTSSSVPAPQDMTITGMVMGSPLYMSPEQMRNSKDVDARSDLWAIGVILFEMVAGVTPFHAPTAPELFAMVLKDEAPRPTVSNPEIPLGLEEIILRCLNKAPAKRYRNAAELAEALLPYARNNLAALPPASSAEAATSLWRPAARSVSDSGDKVDGDSPTRIIRGEHPSASDAGSGQSSPAPAQIGTVAHASPSGSASPNPATPSEPTSVDARSGSETDAKLTRDPLPAGGTQVMGAQARPPAASDAGSSGQTGRAWAPHAAEGQQMASSAPSTPQTDTAQTGSRSHAPERGNTFPLVIAAAVAACAIGIGVVSFGTTDPGPAVDEPTATQSPALSTTMAAPVMSTEAQMAPAKETASVVALEALAPTVETAADAGPTLVNNAKATPVTTAKKPPLVGTTPKPQNTDHIRD